MDSRASIPRRLGVVPVLVAVLLSLAAPVLATTVPEAPPEAPQPHVPGAGDAPHQVAFTLEGCSLDECPELEVTKEQVDANGAPTDMPVEAGLPAFFAIHVVNHGPGTAYDVVVTESAEDLPDGVSWEVDAPAAVSCISGVSTEEGQSFSCELGDLEPDETVSIIVSGLTDRADCGALVNTARLDASNNDDQVPPATATILVSCPEVAALVIDKVADTEVITLSGPNDALVADPSVVTWTLAYTLTDGPVTNAVITDEVPVGFEFLDASDGGVEADGVVTWTFPALSETGSVTFRTTVNPETVSRTGPTVNTAVIDSDETAPDDAEDSVTVVVEGPPLGGNPTPKPPELPDTAAISGPDGRPITVPVELLAAFFLGSLGAMALATVSAINRRR